MAPFPRTRQRRPLLSRCFLPDCLRQFLSKRRSPFFLQFSPRYDNLVSTPVILQRKLRPPIFIAPATIQRDACSTNTINQSKPSDEISSRTFFLYVGKISSSSDSDYDKNLNIGISLKSVRLKRVAKDKRRRVHSSNTVLT